MTDAQQREAALQPFCNMKIDVLERRIYELSPELMKILLSDKTTRGYIRWGSDNYADFGLEYQVDQEMTPDIVAGNIETLRQKNFGADPDKDYMAVIQVQPRVMKTEEEKTRRTRDKAEVFTPSWVCNEQNNVVDAAWFGRDDVFNIAGDKSWVSVPGPVAFPRDKIWKDYVDARRMEISCGEAPYLVSRYDTVTGEIISVKDRIGLLDRKLRIVCENAETEEEWMQWVVRAYQSCYGYDYAGDNVLLARENMLYTFVDYMETYIGRTPTVKELKKIANIITWNIWQMNGLTMTAPFSKAAPAYKQMTMFDFLEDGDDKEEAETADEIPCKIFDWRANESIEFRSLLKEK